MARPKVNEHPITTEQIVMTGKTYPVPSTGCRDFQEQYFGILRMTMRISRSSVFTFALLGLSLSILCLLRIEGYRIPLCLTFLVLGALLAGLAWNAFLKSTAESATGQQLRGDVLVALPVVQTRVASCLTNMP